MRNIILTLTIFFIACSEKRQAESEAEEKPFENDKIVVSVAITNTCQEPLSFNTGKGLSKDIVEALNLIQDKYYFVHESLPTKRLEELGKAGKIDIAAFHNKDWGWQGMNVSRTIPMVKSKDVFIARKRVGRTQEYFEDYMDKSTVGVMGFHYKFLNEKKHGTLIKTHNEKSVIDMISFDRGEIGIVSNITLHYLKIIDPEKHNGLLISKKFDSEYERYYVIMENSPITAENLDDLLKKLHSSGTLKKLYNKYGLEFTAEL